MLKKVIETKEINIDVTKVGNKHYCLNEDTFPQIELIQASSFPITVPDFVENWVFEDAK